MNTQLATRRLLLRRWRPDDRPAFRQMNADPEVMAMLGPPLAPAQSDALLDHIEAQFVEHGFGLWCVDRAGECIGFTGLSIPGFRAGLEIGWRLRSAWWGQGYASEASRAVLACAFADPPAGLGLAEVLSFTATTNERSQRVMRAIGLERDLASDFVHPALPSGSPLGPHVLYRLTRVQFHANAAVGPRRALD